MFVHFEDELVKKEQGHACVIRRNRVTPALLRIGTGSGFRDGVRLAFVCYNRTVWRENRGSRSMAGFII